MTQQRGQGSIEDLIVVLADELAQPPEMCERAMALVVGEGGADHLGLLTNGGIISGGLGLLASVVTARTRPRSCLLLEWVYAEALPRRYLGWAVERSLAQVAWRRMRAEELRAVVNPHTRRALGESSGAMFEE